MPRLTIRKRTVLAVTPALVDTSDAAKFTPSVESMWLSSPLPPGPMPRCVLLSSTVKTSPGVCEYGDIVTATVMLWPNVASVRV